MGAPVFEALSFEQARGLAESNGKLLLIDFTAEWCAPCKNMERTTWRDPSVVEWLEGNAICIQIDGDASPELMAQHAIRAFPTVLCLKGHVELDRLTGARGASSFLDWLTGLRAGRTELEALLKADPDDLHLRLRLGQKLLDLRRDDEALEVFAWLWEHALEVEPAWVGVRGSYLLDALQPLVERSSQARERFGRFRDEAETTAPADFISLNQLLGQNGRTLAWLRGMAAGQVPAGTLTMHADAFLSLIERREDWAIVGRSLCDPVADFELAIERHRQMAAELPPGFPADQLESMLSALSRFQVGRAEFLLRALHASGRLEEARSIEQLARSTDDTEAMIAAIARSH
jgi:thioredoxin 1